MNNQAAAKFERAHTITPTTAPVLLSHIFAERAKRLLNPAGGWHSPTVTNVHALMLLAYHATNAADGGNAWILHGAAVRLAMQLGMHLDPREPPLRNCGICVPTYAKTWAYLFAYDTHLTVTHGRPMGIDEVRLFFLCPC